MRDAIVITGANAGIGRAVAEALAPDHPLVLVCRDPERGGEAADALRRRGGEVALVLGELSELDGMRAAAEGVLSATTSIRALVHNAGVWPTRLARTSLGVERSFAVHVLAPHVLNARLWARLGPSSRVVYVGAGLAAAGRPELDDAQTGARFSSLRTYADTKLCAARHAVAQARRSDGPTVNALHPGVIRTGLGQEGLVGWLIRPVKLLWGRPEQGAAPVVRLATSPELDGVTGRWFDEDREAPWPGGADDDVLAEALWERCAALTGMSGAPPPG